MEKDKILIVDDEEEIRRQLKWASKNQGRREMISFRTEASVGELLIGISSGVESRCLWWISRLDFGE